MSRAPATFRQKDMTRAIKAVAAAGMKVQSVEVGRDGKITVLTEPAADNGDAETSTS